MIDRKQNNLWYRRLDDAMRELGGFFNAHLHLDRAGTLDEIYMEDIGHRILDTSHISLHAKHSLITSLHRGRAYEPGDFIPRVNRFIDDLVAVKTRRADTLVDITDDCVGMRAFRMMREIKEARRGEIDLRLGAYSPFGFEKNSSAPWELIVEGAREADFIAALPEADEIDEYPTHIGFEEHCRRMLLLAKELGKPLHVHTDQRNEPSEAGTERLIKVIREVGGPVSATGETMIWAVHLISPSTYDEKRFRAMVEGMVECGVGLITCPSAAIGMRAYRPILTPAYNSIPRVLEMLAAGIHVRVGSDNISDICSPNSTADLVDELFVLSAALRFYHPGILARMGAGLLLTAEEREFVAAHLAANEAEVAKFIAQSGRPS